jgi:23S rRNA (adenine2503-C2)-methyltransferase
MERLMPQDIRDFTLPELEKIVSGLGEPPYRAEQVFRWLYRQRIVDYDAMVNIPAALREKLSAKYSIFYPKKASRLISADGTQKILFRLKDGNYIESVIIPSKKRNTICLSTQLGCARGCVFCASGDMGFTRNLSPSEITGQYLSAEEILGSKITNIVFMGMGEPFDNYDNLCRAIRILNSPFGANISAGKITVSTAGIIENIYKYSSFDIPANLAVSLHAPDEKTRSLLMPLNRKYPIKKLFAALLKFKNTGKKLTLEYLLLKGLNDSIASAGKLSRMANRLGCPVNIIPFNPVRGKGFEPPDENTVRQFISALRSKGSNVFLRRPMGVDISAACGQLAGRKK